MCVCVWCGVVCAVCACVCCVWCGVVCAVCACVCCRGVDVVVEVCHPRIVKEFGVLFLSHTNFLVRDASVFDTKMIFS